MTNDIFIFLVCRLVGMTSPGSRNPEPIDNDTGFPFLNDNSLKFLDRLSVPVPTHVGALRQLIS